MMLTTRRQILAPSFRLLSFLIWTLLLAMPLGLLAQTSQVAGNVQDPQHAAIGSALLTLTNANSGDKSETTTSSEGVYAFPLLVPGHYNLKVEKSGFEIQNKTDIVVQTGSSSVVNVILKVGSDTQVVEVSAGPELLQSDSSAVTSIIETQTVTDMPLIGRSTAQLQRLSGFVVPIGGGSSASYEIAGGRGNNAIYLVDGGSLTNGTWGTHTIDIDPPAESVQEFQLSLSDYSANLGRTGGGVIQFTTKSGTNQFHAVGYEYYRSENLQATPLFTTVRPPLDYNLFGGSLGGPILKNRTHFYALYQGALQTTSSTQTLSVPSTAEAGGDFSALLGKFVVIDPNTGKQAVGDDGTLNKLPSAELDPIGAKIAAFYPTPNVTGAALNTSNYSVNQPSHSKTEYYVTRIDHDFSERDRAFIRLLGEQSYSRTPGIFPTDGTSPSGSHSRFYEDNINIGWYHNFTSHLINEVRYDYDISGANSFGNGAQTNIDSQIGLTGVNTQYFPSVSVSGLSGVGSSNLRFQNPIYLIQYTDNLSYLRGKHQFRTGVEVFYAGDHDLYKPTAGGSFSFTANGVNSGNAAVGSLVNLLLGRVASASIAEAEPLHPVATSWAAYLQDDWRITTRLTFNLGLRWDTDSPRHEINNRQNSFNATAINPVSNTPGIITFSGINGVSKYANQWDLHEFGPRLGFAYSAHRDTVVHGGFAILYPDEYDSTAPVSAYTGFSNALSLSSANPSAGTPAFLLKNNATSGLGQAAYPTAAQLTPGYGAVTVGSSVVTAPQYYGQNRITGYFYETSLGVQQQLGANWVFDIGYLGTFGHHLADANNSGVNINQVTPANLALLAANSSLSPQSYRPFPQFGNVSLLAADFGNSSYHGVNFGLKRQYSGGLQVQVNYTFSKLIDNATAQGNLAGLASPDVNYWDPKSWRGLGDNDVRHRIIGDVLYQLPIGSGKLLDLKKPFLNNAVGGWKVGSIVEWRTGTPLGVVDTTNNTNSFSGGVRPNLTGNPNDLGNSRSRSAKIAEWFDISAFGQNSAYTFGNAPRTFGTGPQNFQADASLLKNFSTWAHSSVQFRAEALNVLNHANLGNPGTSYGSTTFGKISSLQGGTTSRVLQFAVRIAY
jgi:hypothetical protein